ncbi:hypothetical protein D3C87_1576690 [compost metagenome]
MVRLGFNNIQSSQCASHGCGRHARAEHERARAVFQVIDRSGVTGNESAQGSQRFAECPHNEVGRFGKAEIRSRSRTFVTDYPKAVRVVDKHRCIELLRDCIQFGQFYDVAFHTENTVGSDQLHGLFGQQAKLFAQVVHVVVRILDHFRERQAAAIDDGCMVAFVEDQVVVTAGEA